MTRLTRSRCASRASPSVSAKCGGGVGGGFFGTFGRAADQGDDLDADLGSLLDLLAERVGLPTVAEDDDLLAAAPLEEEPVEANAPVVERSEGEAEDDDDLPGLCGEARQTWEEEQHRPERDQHGQRNEAEASRAQQSRRKIGAIAADAPVIEVVVAEVDLAQDRDQERAQQAATEVLGAGFEDRVRGQSGQTGAQEDHNGQQQPFGSDQE
jgi:hypothetical protein